MTKDERNDLAANNMKLVWWVLNKLRIPPEQRDDYISAGNYGLAQAAINYDPARDTRFSTLAVFCIKSEISKLATHNSRLKRGGNAAPLPLDASAQSYAVWHGLDNSGETRLADVIPHPGAGPLETVLLRESLQELGVALKALKPAEAEALRDIYGLSGREPQRSVDIARRKGVTGACIRARCESGRQKLRGMLEGAASQ